MFNDNISVISPKGMRSWSCNGVLDVEIVIPTKRRDLRTMIAGIGVD